MKEIILLLCKRYEKILMEKGDFYVSKEIMYSDSHLLDMITDIRINIDKFPTHKLNTWVGFIQGVMSVSKLIDVNEERDFTRPLFNNYSESLKEKININDEWYAKIKGSRRVNRIRVLEITEKTYEILNDYDIDITGINYSHKTRHAKEDIIFLEQLESLKIDNVELVEKLNDE